MGLPSTMSTTSSAWSVRSTWPSKSIAACRWPFLIASSHALSNPDVTSRSLTVIPEYVGSVVRMTLSISSGDRVAAETRSMCFDKPSLVAIDDRTIHGGASG